MGCEVLVVFQGKSPSAKASENSQWSTALDGSASPRAVADTEINAGSALNTWKIFLILFAHSASPAPMFHQQAHFPRTAASTTRRHVPFLNALRDVGRPEFDVLTPPIRRGFLVANPSGRMTRLPIVMPAASDSSACFQRVGLTMAFFPLRNPLCDGTTTNDKHGHPTLDPELATPLSASSSRCHAPPTCRIQAKSH